MRLIFETRPPGHQIEIIHRRQTQKKSQRKFPNDPKLKKIKINCSQNNKNQI
jgi:hypothetical protein